MTIARDQKAPPRQFELKAESEEFWNVFDRSSQAQEVCGRRDGLLLGNEGDHDIKLGERVEIYPSNLDTGINVFDRIYVARGESIVDAWSIMGRTGAPQW